MVINFIVRVGYDDTKIQIEGDKYVVEKIVNAIKETVKQETYWQLE